MIRTKLRNSVARDEQQVLEIDVLISKHCWLKIYNIIKNSYYIPKDGEFWKENILILFLKNDHDLFHQTLRIEQHRKSN